MSMRRSPANRSTLARAISTLRRRTWTGLLPSSWKEVFPLVHSLSFIWECLFTEEQSVRRCLCSSGIRSPTGSQDGPIDIYPLEEDSRSSRAPWKPFQSISSKPSSLRLVPSNCWTRFLRGFFGVQQMRGNGLIGSAGTKSACQHPKEASVFATLKRYSEPSLLSFGGGSGSKTPSGQDI